MAVKKKAGKTVQPHQYSFDDIINRGGKTTVDTKLQAQTDEEIRFTLRIPQKMINKLDKDRVARVGNVSRNQWILEAISEHLS
jgi:hypothetical protein